MGDYIPKDVEILSNKIRTILEQEGFVDRFLQLKQGQLWGRIKDNLPKEGLQLHVRAFYTNGKLLFRAHTEPHRLTLEHIPECFRGYGEGIRIFMDTMKKNGIDIKYEGNILDLYVIPERPKTLTPWIPLAVVGGIILFFVVVNSLTKPKGE